mgnify:CR=1 FL=1
MIVVIVIFSSLTFHVQGHNDMRGEHPCVEHKSKPYNRVLGQFSSLLYYYAMELMNIKE